MSDPLAPERPGDLAALGVSARQTVPFDEMPEQDVEEAPVTTAADETSKEEAPLARAGPPEDQTQPTVEEDAEQVEAVQEESILAALVEQDKPSEAPPDTSLVQENSRLKGEIEGYRKAMEEQIRKATGPVPEPEAEEDLFNSPVVANLLERVREEEPGQYVPTIARILEKKVSAGVDERFKAQEAERAQERQKQQQSKQATEYQQGIHTVFEDIKSQGGLEAELVDQLYSNPNGSYLGQRFSKSSMALTSPEGIRGAVREVAAELQARHKAQQSTAASVSPSIEASAGGGSASHRGVSLGEKPKQKSEEEQVADDILNVGRRSDKLEFLR